jgi:hypothetical protein
LLLLAFEVFSDDFPLALGLVLLQGCDHIVFLGPASFHVFPLAFGLVV